MSNLFEIKNNLIYSTEDLQISSVESFFESNLSFIPPKYELHMEYSAYSGKLLRSIENGGVCILRYLDNDKRIYFKNVIFREKTDNYVFRFCSEKDCILEKNKAIIQILYNVDHNFNKSELNLERISPFFEIEDNGFQKSINFASTIKLLPKRYYKIDSGIDITGTGKYLFLPELQWKHGLVILRSFEITKPIKNICFEVYNAEDFEVTLGNDKNYNTIGSIIKLKE